MSKSIHVFSFSYVDSNNFVKLSSPKNTFRGHRHQPLSTHNKYKQIFKDWNTEAVVDGKL